MADETPDEILAEPVGALSGLHRQCPHCGSERLKVVTTEAVMGCDGTNNLFCTACRRCWHVDGGRAEQVDRYLCPGCPERLRCFEPLIHGGLRPYGAVADPPTHTNS